MNCFDSESVEIQRIAIQEFKFIVACYESYQKEQGKGKLSKEFIRSLAKTYLEEDNQNCTQYGVDEEFLVTSLNKNPHDQIVILDIDTRLTDEQIEDYE